MNLIPSNLGGDKFYANGNIIPLELAGRQYVKEEEITE
jgi:hypothetical protein